MYWAIMRKVVAMIIVLKTKRGKMTKVNGLAWFAMYYVLCGWEVLAPLFISGMDVEEQEMPWTHVMT